MTHFMNLGYIVAEIFSFFQMFIPTDRQTDSYVDRYSWIVNSSNVT